MIKKILQNILSFLFPPCCYLCRKEGKVLCLTCINSLKKPVDTPYPFITSLFSYKEVRVKKFIHAMKYFHRKDIAESLAWHFIPFIEKEKDLLLFETESYYNGTLDFVRDVTELLSSLEEQYLKKQFADTMVLLQRAEQMRDSALVLRYLEECQNISQKINTLKHT